MAILFVETYPHYEMSTGDKKFGLNSDTTSKKVGEQVSGGELCDPSYILLSPTPSHKSNISFSAFDRQKSSNCHSLIWNYS